MVTTMRQSSVSQSIIQGRCCDTGALRNWRADEILLAVLKFPEPEEKLIQEVQTICKLLAVNPISTAAGEGSFSSVRTASEDLASIQDGWWEVYSNLVVTLNGYKLRTDSVYIADVAQEFVSSNEDGKRNFGTADNFKVAILGRFIQHIGCTGYYNTWRRLC